MIYRPHGNNFIYIDEKSIGKSFPFDGSCDDLVEKIVLLEQFLQCFLSKVDINIRKESLNIDINNYVYISKIIKSKTGYLFKLSNDTLQMVYLDDKTQLLDDTQLFTNKHEEDTIIYIDKKGKYYFNYDCVCQIKKKLILKNEIIEKSNRRSFHKKNYNKSILNNM